MTLSNRLWRAIAAQTSDAPAHATLWAKITLQATGKRHYLRSIALSPLETWAVGEVVRHQSLRNDYMRFLVKHEREHNPEFGL